MASGMKKDGKSTLSFKAQMEGRKEKSAKLSLYTNLVGSLRFGEIYMEKGLQYGPVTD